MGKVVNSVEELVQELEPFKKSSQKIVFTNGCFDLLHVGHVRYLQEAKAQGDILVLGLNSDKSVSELKGPERPIQKQNDRAEILAALACVDYVCIFDESTPIKMIESITPDILVKGGDWKPDQIVGSEHVLRNGGKVKSLLFIDGKSTTRIVEKMKT